jgi:twitching motility protein PilT
MQTKVNLRKEERLKFKNIIQYEEYFDNGLYGTPIATSTLDISSKGIGFYTNKEFKLNTKLRISCYISDTENISFIASVVRLQLYKSNPIQYLVGTEIINISDQNLADLKLFLQEININSILDKINLDNVMDIHFMVGYPITLKRMGKLKTVGRVLDEYTIKNLLLNLLDEDSYANFIKLKELNFITTYKDKRLRFNMHFQKGKIEAICRIVNSKIPTPSQLGLPPTVESLIKNHTKGLIIIAGRTGSGKTTSLASLISYLSKIISGVIISIEDPIEYIHEKNQCIIKQRELGRDTLSYASALRNALRQNPDVLIIGETLDAATIELLLNAAESGMLVLTTIHSPTVTQVMDRIASYFPAEAQKHTLTRLSLVLKGIIVQELFPRIIGDEGLVLATEVLLVNETGKKIIRDGDWKLIPDYILRGKSQGMQTMKDSIENLVNKGFIDMGYAKEYLPNYSSSF